MHETKDLTEFSDRNKSEIYRLIVGKSCRFLEVHELREYYQGFLVYLFKYDSLRKFDVRKASFATYINTCLTNYLYVQHKKNNCKKNKNLIFTDTLPDQRSTSNPLEVAQSKLDLPKFVRFYLSHFDESIRDRELKFLSLRFQGLKQNHIAKALNLSPARIGQKAKFLKNCYKKFKNLCE